MNIDSYLKDPLIQTVQEALHPVDITDDADQCTRDGQRKAAVLMPLIPRASGWQVLLTKRPDTMANHPGQISFPGGGSDGTETIMETALRETDEEVSIPQSNIHLLGRLDSFNAVSKFRLTPFVGIVDPATKIIPCEREVADMFEIPLTFFMNPDNHIERPVHHNGNQIMLYDMPYTEDSGTVRHVWGMTAMMLYRLYQRAYLKDYTHPDAA